MDGDALHARLEALLAKRGQPGAFAHSWSLEQKPVSVQADALGALMKRVGPALGTGPGPLRGADLRPFLDAAARELESNVACVAALAESRAYPPLAYITWLWKVSEALQRIATDSCEPAAATPLEPASQPELLRVAPEPLFLPLTAGPGLAGFAIDPLLDLANRETKLLGRRRRLFEAARRVLLETAASTPLLEHAVQARLAAITQGVREVNQWQSQGVEPDVDLSHQIRRAVHGRDEGSLRDLFGVLQTLGGSAQLSPALRRRIGVTKASLDRQFGRRTAPDLARLRESTFGASAARAIERGCDRARRENEATSTAQVELVQAGGCVDGCFELGRTVAPVRVLEEQQRMAEVGFPTQTLVLRTARGPNDVPTSLIGDPRSLLYDLASHNLLARRYLAERSVRRSSPARYSEARYYLLDGSASMSGRRGRMRDAILLSELATMIRHLETGEAAARPVVYYRFFSKTAEPRVKASTISEAQACIEAILTRKSRGETDIETALVASFAELAQERQNDPTLARAQVVLVTDGMAEVDAARVWRAREALGSMPVQLSVIALGSENPALKALAAWQRARGEAVFYHFVTDETQYSMLREVRVTRAPLSSKPAHDAASTERVSLPQLNRAQNASPNGNAELWLQLEHLVDELCVLRVPPDLDELERAPFLEGAFEELELSLSDSRLEAERARFEAQKRDYRSLGLRFDRWFPDPGTLGRGQGVCPPDELLAVIEVVLLTVAELSSYLGGSPLTRRVDAIEILERLLLEAGVSPWGYCRALPFSLPAAREALGRLRSG